MQDGGGGGGGSWVGLQSLACIAIVVILIVAAVLPRALGLLASRVLYFFRGRRISALDIGKLDLVGATCAAFDVRIEFSRGFPIASIHVGEARFTGEWGSLAQLLGTLTRSKLLPFSVRGVRVVLASDAPPPETDAPTKPPTARQPPEASVTPRRLTWVGLLRATIQWNVITMAEVTIEDIVVEDRARSAALVVQRIVMYSRVGSEEERECAASSSADREAVDAGATTVVHASSLRLKAATDSALDPTAETEEYDVADSPALPNFVDLESVGLSAAIAIRGQDIALEKVTVDPEAMEVSLGMASLMLAQELLAGGARRTAPPPTHNGDGEREGLADPLRRILTASAPLVEVNASELRLRVLGDVFSDGKSAGRRGGRQQRPVLIVRGAFARSTPDDGGGLMLACGWSGVEATDWAPTLVSDDAEYIDNGGRHASSTPLRVGRTAARLTARAPPIGTGALEVGVSLDVGHVQLDIIGWRDTLHQLSRRFGEVFRAGMQGREAARPPRRPSRLVSKVDCTLGGIGFRAMADDEDDASGRGESAIGLYVGVDAGGASFEDDGQALRACLSFSKVTCGLLRKLTVGRPPSPRRRAQRYDPPPPGTLSCRFLESEIISSRALKLAASKGPEAVVGLDGEGDVADVLRGNNTMIVLNIAVDDSALAVRAREIHADTLRAVGSLREMLRGAARESASSAGGESQPSGPGRRSIELKLTNCSLILDTASALDIAKNAPLNGHHSAGPLRRKCAIRISELTLCKAQTKHVSVALSALRVVDQTERSETNSVPIVAVQEMYLNQVDTVTRPRGGGGGADIGDGVDSGDESRVSIEANHVRASWDLERHLLLLAVGDMLDRARRIGGAHNAADMDQGRPRQLKKRLISLQLHDATLLAEVDDNSSAVYAPNGGGGGGLASPQSPKRRDTVGVSLDFYSSHNVFQECRVDNLRLSANGDSVVSMQTFSVCPPEKNVELDGDAVTGCTETPRRRRQPRTASAFRDREKRPFIHHQRSASNAELRYASARARSRAAEFDVNRGQAATGLLRSAPEPSVVILDMMDVQVSLPSRAALGSLVNNFQLVGKALESIREGPTKSNATSPRRAHPSTPSTVGDRKTETSTEEDGGPSPERAELEIRVVVQSFSFEAHHDQFEAWLRSRQVRLGKLVAQNLARCDALSRSVGTMDIREAPNGAAEAADDDDDDVWVRNGSFNSSSAVKELQMQMQGEYMQSWKAKSVGSSKVFARIEMKIIELLLIRPAVGRDAGQVAEFIDRVEDARNKLPVPCLEAGTIWCLDASVSDLSLSFCDMPVPLLKSSSMTLSGALALYRQGGVLPPSMTERTIVVGMNRRVCLRLPKVGARPPVKASTWMSLNLQQPTIEFSVGMEPYIADLQRAIDRLIPKSPAMPPDAPPPKRFPWFDRLRYVWRGKFDVKMSSATVRLYAVASATVCGKDPHVAIRFGNLMLSMLPSRQQFNFSNVEVSAFRPVKVDCEMDVQCVKRQLQYSVVIAECPTLEVTLAYDWRLVGGRNPADHFLHQGGVRGGIGTREPAHAGVNPSRPAKTGGEHDVIVLHDEYRSTELRLAIRANFGRDGRRGIAGDDAHAEHSCGPTFRVGAADVQWLGELLAVLVRPPPGLRGAAGRRRFGQRPRIVSGVKRGLGQLLSTLDITVTAADVLMINRAERDDDPADKMSVAIHMLDSSLKLTREGFYEESDGTAGAPSGATRTPFVLSSLQLKVVHALVRKPCEDDDTAQAERSRADFGARAADFDSATFLGFADSVEVSREREKASSETDAGGGADGAASTMHADSALRVVVAGPKLYVTRESRDAVYSCIENYIDKLRRSSNVRNNRLENEDVDPTAYDAEGTGQGREVGAVLDGDATGKSDLFKLLIGGDGDGCRSPNKFMSNPMREYLNLLLEIRCPQFYLQSESAAGRFLLTAAGGLLVGRHLQGSERDKRASTVSLSQVQGHVAGMESLASPYLQWLPDRCLTDDDVGAAAAAGDGRVDGAVTVPDFVERIFEPFELQMHLSRNFEDAHARAGPADDEAATQITLSTPSIQAKMDSLQYHVFMDVVSNILLSPIPPPRHSSDMIPLGTPTDTLEVRKARMSAVQYHQEAAELVHTIAQLRGCAGGIDEMLPGDTGAEGLGETWDEYLSSSGGIEGRPYWWALRSSPEELEGALVEQWHESRRKAAASTARLREIIGAGKRSEMRASSKLQLKVDRVAWNMCSADESLVESIIHDLTFTKMRREDSSGLIRFAMSEAVVKTPEREVISMWYPTGVAHDEKGCLRIYAVQAGLTDGIPTFEHFEIGIHPTMVQISGPLLHRLWEYFFPKDTFGDDKRAIPLDTPKVKARRRSRFGRAQDPSSPPSSFDENDPTRSQGHFSIAALQRGLPPAQGAQTPIDHASRGRHRRVGSWDGVMVEMRVDAHRPVDGIDNGRGGTKQVVAGGDGRVPSSATKQQLRVSTQAAISSGHSRRQQAKGQKIRLTYMRFNECHIMISYDGNPISFHNRRFVLDARTYNFFEGRWRDFVNRLKWDVIKSVLKSVTGLQGRKLRDLMALEDEPAEGDHSQVFADEGSGSMVLTLESGADHADETEEENVAGTPVAKAKAHRRTASSGKINPVRRLFRGRRGTAAGTSFDGAEPDMNSNGGSNNHADDDSPDADAVRDGGDGSAHSSVVMTSEEMKASMLGLRARPTGKQK